MPILRPQPYLTSVVHLNKLIMLKIIYTALFALLIFSCSSNATTQKETDNYEPTTNSTHSTYSSRRYEKDNEDNDDDEINSSNGSGCKFEDGTYSAAIDYNNSTTGYYQTYTLNVEVQDCQVIEIDFPKGGWLDEDHISPADLDEDGNADVDGEDGKTYEIHIEE